MNNNLKLREKIGTKIFAIMFMGLIITGMSIMIVMFKGGSSMTGNMLTSDIMSAVKAIESRAETYKNLSLSIAVNMAENEDFQRAFESGVKEDIISVAKHILSTMNNVTDFVTITDSSGIVVARTHSEKAGDSVINQRNIVEALNGHTSSYIEQGTEVKLSIRSSSPIRNDSGQIIGAVSTGNRLDNDGFVDEMKVMTGAEITIFLNDERISTTITQNGQRQTGTKMDENIADIVLKKGQIYTSKTSLFDSMYITEYNPIFIGDEIIGAIFAGKSIDHIVAMEKNFGIISILAIIISSTVMLVISQIFINKTISNPIKNILDAAVQIANGELDIKNLTHRSKDEIGLLTINIQNMEQILESLIADMSRTVEEHIKGNMTATVDEKKFNGVYKELASNVNRMVGDYAKNIKDITNGFEAISNGDFDIHLSKMPGQKADLNVAVDLLSENLQSVADEIGMLTTAASQGNLSAKADVGKYSGDWAILLEKLNQLVRTIVLPINQTSDVMLNISKGNFSSKVEGDFKGDFLVLKNSVNSTVNNISSYISEISEVLRFLANDDLTHEIKREYVGDFTNIKEAINKIVAKFNDILLDISKTANHMAMSAQKMSDSSMTLAQGATEQANSVRKLDDSIGIVAERTAKNADTAEKVNTLVENAKSYAERELVMMDKMLDSIEAINKSSADISKIIKVIDNIAFQTNLLALNAAVEASRAGVHGKGFSVVVAEVKKLAQQSKDAAENTSAIIEVSVSKAMEGSRTAAETAKGLKSIVDNISEVSSYINTIADASKEQSASTNEINDGISQVSRVVTANTSISEESAASAEELLSQVEVLRDTTSKFTLKS